VREVLVLGDAKISFLEDRSRKHRHAQCLVQHDAALCTRAQQECNVHVAECAHSTR